MSNVTGQNAGAPNAFAWADDAQGARIGHIDLAIFSHHNAVSGDHGAQSGELGSGVNIHSASPGHITGDFTKGGPQFRAVGSQLGGQRGTVQRQSRCKEQGKNA